MINVSGRASGAYYSKRFNFGTVDFIAKFIVAKRNRAKNGGKDRGSAPEGAGVQLSQSLPKSKLSIRKDASPPACKTKLLMVNRAGYRVVGMFSSDAFCMNFFEGGC